MDALAAVDGVVTGGMNTFILWTLAASTVVFIFDAVGFLPPSWSDRINRNRLHQTIRLLKEFGVDVHRSRRESAINRLEQIRGQDLADRVVNRLEALKVGHPVTVGTQVPVQSADYIDVMGAAAEPNVAAMFARDLTAHWRNVAGVGGTVANYNIDFVVTPKTGSPLLGSAFASELGLPLLLHNPRPKFESDSLDPRSLFDCGKLPEPGSRGLVVDDSSTGGGKAVRLVEDLQKCGWEVSDFLVLFEPQIKEGIQQNAAARLRQHGVTLHSIIKT